MTFPEKLQALRKQRGWSQEELAARLPISRQAVSKWESGAAVPDTANILTLADLFGVSTDYLLRDGCDSGGDTPAVRRKEAEMDQRQSRTAAWAVCIGIQYLGLFWIVFGALVYSSVLIPLLGVTAQIAGITGFEVGVRRYGALPGGPEIRRKFYRAAVWAFALFPCQVTLALLFRLKSGAWSGLPAIYFPSLALLYLAVCLTVTRLLRPHRDRGTS
ncbi:MAG: helix-turn-helix transcriptional regulator [Oscillospiraceae bacterium]|nr:helix-turn-helix transcriptional regulator [Oscillospiraceae bacterium]